MVSKRGFLGTPHYLAGVQELGGAKRKAPTGTPYKPHKVPEFM